MKGNSEQKYIPPVRELPMKIICCCGLLVFIIGLIMYILHVETNGSRLSSDFLDEKMIMNGPAAMLLGYIIFIIPALVLRKQYLEKKRFDRNDF